jgi:peroxiredoxin
MDPSQRRPSAGDAAPDFTAPSTSGAPVTLSSFREKSSVLIAFFPLAFTSTCTAELCAFSDDFDRFADAGVEILPISVDSVDSLREYRSRYQMRSHLLSDFRRDICKLYGVFNERKFYADRSYFLVDRNGVIRWAFAEEVNGKRRSNDEIFSQLGSLGA